MAGGVGGLCRISDIYVVGDSQRDWARAADKDKSRVAHISLLNFQQMSFCMRYVAGFFVFVVSPNALSLFTDYKPT